MTSAPKHRTDCNGAEGDNVAANVSIVATISAVVPDSVPYHRSDAAPVAVVVSGENVNTAGWVNVKLMEELYKREQLNSAEERASKPNSATSEGTKAAATA